MVSPMKAAKFFVEHLAGQKRLAKTDRVKAINAAQLAFRGSGTQATFR